MKPRVNNQFIHLEEKLCNWKFIFSYICVGAEHSCRWRMSIVVDGEAHEETTLNLELEL
jgi:hypothetical protein